MRRALILLAVSFVVAGGSTAEIIDRIAAIVDEKAITTSEIDQLAMVRFYERLDDESDFDYRRRILSNMIAQTLRYRDVSRFGAIEVSKEEIDERISRVVERFDSREAFEEALDRAELSMEHLRSIAKREIEVEAYIAERFSPMIFVPLEEIEQYYRDVWVEERLEKGLELLPISAVREEIRARLKSEQLDQEIGRWTQELRERASVDVYL